jgi:SAM-dependent methyltransferase
MKTERSDILSELEAWYARKNGQYLVEELRQTLESTLDTGFGYHILQLGVTRQHPLFEHSPIHHRIYAGQRGGEDIGLIANSVQLPLESDSIDILIAHHCLEFEADPHQALREMQRVLAPQGRLLIIGFNPYSLFGAATYAKGLLHNSLWAEHRPVSSGRLSDWLRLLGCEVQDCAHMYALPPLGGGKLRQFMTRCDNWLQVHNVPIGGLYVLHAVKQVSGLNRPRRRMLLAREQLIGLAVPKPSAAPSPTPSIHSPRNGDVAA